MFGQLCFPKKIIAVQRKRNEEPQNFFVHHVIRIAPPRGALVKPSEARWKTGSQ